MKYITIILAIFIFESCTKKEVKRETFMTVSVIRDITDFHKLQPDSSVISLFGLSEDKSRAVRFRYSEITDVTLVPVQDIYLPVEIETDKQNKANEPLYRQKRIIQFYDNVKQALASTQVKSDTATLKNSECFSRICAEIKELKKTSSTYKVLEVFSNLFENSNIMDVYSNNFSVIRNSEVEKLSAVFEKTKMLPDGLNGIHVVFCYSPLDRADDQNFSKIASCYKQLIESKGGTVSIQATNKIQLYE